MNISVRHSLIRWFVTYLQGRRQMCTFRKQKSECKSIKGGISQESKLGPLKQKQALRIIVPEHENNRAL